MKVLQVHNSYKNYGGEDVVVEKEFKLLKKKGINIKQLFFDNHNLKISKLFENQDSAAILKKEISFFAPDILHVHNVFYNATPYIFSVAKQMGVPAVMTLHNYRLLCPNALFLRDDKICTKCSSLSLPIYAIKHKCFKDSYLKSTALSASLLYHNLAGTWSKKVNRFIALTHFSKKMFSNSTLGIPSSKIVVKHNSTDDLKQFATPFNRRKDYIYIGRLSKEKGLDVLIEAFNKFPHLRLNLVGDGELKHSLQKLANDNVNFLGRLPFDSIKSLLCSSKALMFPSICFEGLPNTIIESFSAATPVLASDVDNVNNIVKDGYNGYLFKTSNVSSLCALLEHYEQTNREELCKNARSTYEEYYSHEKNYNNLIKIYSEVIQEHEQKQQ